MALLEVPHARRAAALALERVMKRQPAAAEAAFRTGAVPRLVPLLAIAETNTHGSCAPESMPSHAPRAGGAEDLTDARAGGDRTRHRRAWRARRCKVQHQTLLSSDPSFDLQMLQKIHLRC